MLPPGGSMGGHAGPWGAAASAAGFQSQPRRSPKPSGTAPAPPGKVSRPRSPLRGGWLLQASRNGYACLSKVSRRAAWGAGG